MISQTILTQVTASFVGALLALVSAGVFWLMKSAYNQHDNEMRALSKLERIYVLNVRRVTDSLEFINQWIQAAKVNRPFRFQFDSFIVNDEDTFKLKNLKLINRVVPLNYKLGRMNLDLENIYKSYWEIIYKINDIQNESARSANLIKYHETIVETLEKMLVVYQPVTREITETIASVRVVANIRRHSLFGYLSYLFIDVFPTLTEERIKHQVKKLKDELETKKLKSQK